MADDGQNTADDSQADAADEPIRWDLFSDNARQALKTAQCHAAMSGRDLTIAALVFGICATVDLTDLGGMPCESFAVAHWHERGAASRDAVPLSQPVVEVFLALSREPREMISCIDILKRLWRMYPAACRLPFQGVGIRGESLE